MAKILVIRFSAISDVAMAIPVIYSFAMQYPQHQVVVLSNYNVAPVFKRLPKNVLFHGVDLENKYRGWFGLKWLYNDLKKEKYDAIVDLQNTLNTKYLRWHLKLSGVKEAHINEEFWEMHQLTRRRHKIVKRQKSCFEKYAKAFEKTGFPIQLNFISLFEGKERDINYLRPLTGVKKGIKWIGVAPFAPHVGKIYPLSRQEEIIELLSVRPHTKIFLFGGGEKETEILEKWTHQFPNVISIAGKLKIDVELLLMSQMDVMLTMDSVNMQLASLVNTPIVSIWGATHPYAGFTGWGQKPENIVQIDLSCRPCSITGSKACFRKDYACLQGITPEMIVQHIQNIID